VTANVSKPIQHTEDRVFSSPAVPTRLRLFLRIATNTKPDILGTINISSWLLASVEKPSLAGRSHRGFVVGDRGGVKAVERVVHHARLLV
jgi:hypothetical protein